MVGRNLSEDRSRLVDEQQWSVEREKLVHLEVFRANRLLGDVITEELGEGFGFRHL